MTSLIYSSRADKAIIAHEESMLDLYSKHIHPLEPFFRSCGCTVKTGLMWKTFPSDAKSLRRVPFRNGYECYVFCFIEKDGGEVRIRSSDGEADDYPLSAAWMVTSLHRRWWDLKAQMFTDTDVVDADMEEFLSLLRQEH